MLTRRKRMQSLKSTQFVALRGLEYYDEIVAKIKDGQPCTQIGAWIQTIKGGLLDKKRVSVVRQLERLRKGIAPKDIVSKALIAAKEHEMEELISVVKEADYLLKLNRKRIKRNEKLESKAQLSMKNQDSAIQLQIDLIDMNKQILTDLGLLTKNSKDGQDGDKVNLNVNVNLSEKDLIEKENEVIGRIKKRIERIHSLRAGIGKPGKDGGETVPSEEPKVQDNTSNDGGIHKRGEVLELGTGHVQEDKGDTV